jgi:RNA polymerase sigma factor (sigma-70 family)
MEFLTVSEYEELAVRYIKNFVVRRNMPRNIIDDQEAVDAVVNYMMRADEIFDGRGNRVRFRYAYARFGFKNYLTKVRGCANPKQKILRARHLSTFNNKEIERQVDVAVCDDSPSEAFESYEIRQKILNSNLTDRQKDCIIRYYYDKATREEIASHWGCTRQRIDQEIKTALYKLRFALEEYNGEKVGA